MEFLHGGDRYRHKVDYDFSANINPLGMPNASILAAKRGVTLSVHYPDYLGEELCNALSQKEQVPSRNILLGNGCAELIWLLSYALKPTQALLPAPTFQEYESCLRNVSCNISYYPLQADHLFRIDESILSDISGADILFLCNPNNPTGVITNRRLLLQIAEKCQECNTILVIDECFIEFVEDYQEISMVPFLQEYSNLIILKAFTKFYGMPGLRLGYALTYNKVLLENMRGCMQPWNTSIPAQMAGLAALEDTEYRKATYQLMGEERSFLLQEMKKGLTEHIYGSEGNFIFFKADPALQEKLLAKHIFIRDCSNFSNLTLGYYRIAIRSHCENVHLIEVWRKCGVWQR